MASDELICGTPGIICRLDEYAVCPQADFSSMFDAWDRPYLKPTGLITEVSGGELAAAQLDSYVFHSLADGERICYRESEGFGRREWFVESNFASYAGPVLVESAQADGERGAAAAESEKPEVKEMSFFDGALLSLVGVAVLFAICKAIIDAVEEGQRLEALKSEETDGEGADEARPPIVARPNVREVDLDRDLEPWRSEQWFEGLSDYGRREVESILKESVPHMLGDPVFRAEYIRDGRITVEGVRVMLAGGGINYTSVGSLAVTRAMETKADQAKVIPIDAGRGAKATPRRGRFGLFELFKKAGK